MMNRTHRRDEDVQFALRSTGQLALPHPALLSTRTGMLNPLTKETSRTTCISLQMTTFNYNNLYPPS